MQRTRSTQILIAVITSAALAGAGFQLFQLYIVSKVVDNYRIDLAIAREQLKESGSSLTIDRFLNDVPPFIDRYGISKADYLDGKGKFMPNGHHWEKWTIETKAAAISMWTEELKLSSWQTYKVIHTVNDYYSKSDKNTPAVYLIQAAAQQ